LCYSHPDAAAVDVDRLWRLFLRRFDLEHTFRFCKQTLGLTRPRLRSPAQADRWAWLVVVAYTQLRLARGLATDLRRPWERPVAPGQLSPGSSARAPSGAAIAASAGSWAHRPARRNPPGPAPDAPKAVCPPRRCAIPSASTSTEPLQPNPGKLPRQVKTQAKSLRAGE